MIKFKLKANYPTTFKYAAAVLLAFAFLASTVLHAERVRLERKYGLVNAALQAMLIKQIQQLPSGIGKIELGAANSSKSACMLDLYVSPETIYVIVKSKKPSLRTEFYVDHPHTSFKDILFQAMVKDDDNDEVGLSVDAKSMSYKFYRNSSKFRIELSQNKKSIKCEFDLNDSVMIPDETE